MTKIRVIQCPNHMCVIPCRARCTYSTAVLFQIRIFRGIVISKAILAIGSLDFPVLCEPRQYLTLDFQSGSRTDILTCVITVEYHIEHFLILRQ